MSLDCSRPLPTRCGSKGAALLVALAVAVPLAAQVPNEARVGVLARLLAAADARAFDAALFSAALRDPDAGVRRQAALAAGRIGDPAALDLVIGALADSDHNVQAAGAFALGLLKDKRAVPALIALVRSVATADQGAPQSEAAIAIARIGGVEAAGALHEMLGNGTTSGVATPPAASAALLYAWRLADRAPVSSLAGYADDPDPAVRWHALYSLGRLHARAGVPLFITALQDSDAQVRAIAARGITRGLLDSSRTEWRSVADRLRPLLADTSAAVRINVIRALSTFHEPTLAGDVVALAGDPAVNVAVQAETTLGVLGGSAAITALSARAQSAVFAVRRQAVIALAQADTAAGIAAATPLASDGDWRMRSVAAEAYGAARSRSRLEAQLGDADGRVVAQALQALGRVVTVPDTLLLRDARRLLEHQDAAVRSVAADLLARVPDVADVDRLAQAYTRAAGDPFDDARLSAVGALAAIAQASAAGRLRVATAFVGATPQADDYLVRRLAADRLPDAAAQWGPPTPVATRRTDAEYRDIARRYLTGAPAPRVTIETDRGTLVVELFPDLAPMTVSAILGLVDRHYFDGSRWHRVVPNFVAQDGDPRGDGWGGPGFVLRDELNPTPYETGTVGMALSGPDTGGSQFFITHSPQPHLDGVYTVIGHLVSGAPLLPNIGQGDRIRSMHQ